MTSRHINSAKMLLRCVRSQTDRIGVAVSYGKDSLCTLDLACSMFPWVSGYYLFRVRGLKIVEQWREEAERRFGVVIRDYPHFDLARCYNHHVFQPHWDVGKVLVGIADIEAKFRADAGVDFIAYGWRRNDSLSRALILKSCGGIDEKAGRVYPLRCWKRRDVLAYLDDRGIPIPDGLGRKDQGGLDFHSGAIKALRESGDLDRWLADFPFACIQQNKGDADKVTVPAADS